MVEVAVFVQKDLGGLPYFGDLFPNIRELELVHCDDIQNFGAVHFPHLTHLTVSCFSYTDFTMENVVNLLRGCPKLLEFRFDEASNHKIMMNDLLNMIKKNPLMTKLTIKYSGLAKVGHAEMMQFCNAGIPI